MPKITSKLDYNGFPTKVVRLGLSEIVAEVEAALLGFELLVEERKHANGTRGLRQAIDAAFNEIGGWTKITSGGIDWTKQSAKGTTIGVEVQVSGRSDMLAVDIMHLKERLIDGRIDAGLIIVPNDKLSYFLTDRTPNLATAVKHVKDKASDMPIRIVAFGHDGVGTALVKMRTNVGKISD